VALLLFNTIIDDLSDSGYIAEKDVVLRIVQVRRY
jgi:hypothetical protein